MADPREFLPESPDSFEWVISSDGRIVAPPGFELDDIPDGDEDDLAGVLADIHSDSSDDDGNNTSNNNNANPDMSPSNNVTLSDDPPPVAIAPAASSSSTMSEDNSVNFALAQAHESLHIVKTFTRQTRWRGSRNARFLVLLDGPSPEDGEHVTGFLDCKQVIYQKIQKALFDFYENQLVDKDGNPTIQDRQKWSLAMASFSIGWDGSKYSRQPNAMELYFSYPYVKKLLLGMPNLELIITIGKFGAQFVRHNLNVLDFCLRDSFDSVSRNDKLSPMMYRFKDFGKFDRFHINGQRAFRTLALPFHWDRLFQTMIFSALYKLEDTGKQNLRSLKINPIPYNVMSKPLEFTNTKAIKLLTFERFQYQIHENLKQLYGERRQSTPTSLTSSGSLGCYSASSTPFGGYASLDDDDTMQGVPTPTIQYAPRPMSLSTDDDTNTYDHFSSIEAKKKTIPGGIFRDASMDSYALNYKQPGTRYFCLSELEYESPANVFHAYCSTPEGNPVRIAVTGATFVFYFTPHCSFITGHSSWKDDTNELRSNDLDWLRETLRKKLPHLYHQNKQVLFTPHTKEKDCVSLSLARGYRDFKNGYWHNRDFTYIRCEVRHYDYVDAVSNVLRRIVKEFSDLKENKDDKTKKFPFNIYDTTTAENMFISRYQFFLSHWLRFKNFKLDYPVGIDPVNGVHHCRQLTGVYCLEDNKNEVTALNPIDRVDLEFNGMTSSDVPPNIRMAYDIETRMDKEYEREYGQPIICICAAVREHDPQTTKIFSVKRGDVPPDFTPDDGYIYYGFMVGDVEKNPNTTELKGCEHVFEFADEGDMLRAYLYFRRLLVPNYIITQNGKGFDDPFVFNRARVLNIDYLPVGRRDNACTRVVWYQFQSIARGTKTITHMEGQEGIAFIDTLEVAFSSFKRKSYKLGALAADFVGMTKSDMPYAAIEGHWKGDQASRRRLIDYCYRDAQLVDQLVNCWQTATVVNEMARVVSTIPESYNYEKGMQENVMVAMLKVKATRGLKVIIPSNKAWIKSFNSDVIDHGKADKSRATSTSADSFQYVMRTDESYQDESRQQQQQPSKKQRTASAPASSSSIDSFFEKQPSQPRMAPAPTSQNHMKRGRDVITTKAKRKLVDGTLAKVNTEQNKMKRDATFRGAIVMKVPLGWHPELPVGCGDFAALYPSIIRVDGISPEAKVYGDEMELRGVTIDMLVESSPNLAVINKSTGRTVRVFMIKKEIYTGIYALMEDDLVAARNVAKKLIDKYELKFLEDGVTPNPHYNLNLAQVMRQRSEGLKFICNGAYGILGTEGPLGDRDCAKAVTYHGQDGTCLVRQKTEEFYGGVCVGGDTDSVFFKFPGDKNGNYRFETLPELEKFAKETWIPSMNKFFKWPMYLEYEKAMLWLCTVASKHYIYEENIMGGVPKIKCKGIETVRRDSFPLTQEILADVFKILVESPKTRIPRNQLPDVIEDRKARAVARIRKGARELLTGQVPFSYFNMGMGLSKEFYNNVDQPHLAVCRKIQARGGEPPSFGDRVHYVYVKTPNVQDPKTGAIVPPKGFQRAEDPEYAIEHQIELDHMYYFERKLEKPISRIMCHFLHEEIYPVVRNYPQWCNRDIRMLTEKEAKRFHKDMVEATSKFLFHSADKKDVHSKNPEHRYRKMCGNKISAVRADTSNRSSIAFYTDNSINSVEKTMTRHGITNEAAARQQLHVQYEDDIVTQYTQVVMKEQARFKALEKTCRGCLKLTNDSEEIQCMAHDCKHYWPRVEANGAAKRSLSKLQQLFGEYDGFMAQNASLIRDMEDLSF